MRERAEVHDELIAILDAAHTPDALDDARWLDALFVQDFRERATTSAPGSPAMLLLAAIAECALDLRPARLPSGSKREDARWGQFGMLAALYLAPLQHNLPPPASLRAAAAALAESVVAISMPSEHYTAAELRNALARFDAEIPTSTLSDWKRAGLERLADAIWQREQQFSHASGRPSPLLDDTPSLGGIGRLETRLRDPRWLIAGIALLLVIGAGVLAASDARSYREASAGLIRLLADESSAPDALRAQAVQTTQTGQRHARWLLLLPQHAQRHTASLAVLEQATALEASLRDAPQQPASVTALSVALDTLSTLDASADDSIDAALHTGYQVRLHTNLRALQVSYNNLMPADLLATPEALTIWSTHTTTLCDAIQLDALRLQALEGTGGDSAQRDDWIAAGSTACIATHGLNRTLDAVLDTAASDTPTMGAIIQALSDASEVLSQADATYQAQADLPVDGRAVIGSQVSMLPLVTGMPAFLGLGDHPARTYLVIVQDSNELRATGGFITAAGTLVIDDGQIAAFDLRPAPAWDTPDGRYPLAPQPMQESMGLELWLLRDANWHPDFPFTAAFLEQLFIYASGASVDGVIALDDDALSALADLTDSALPPTAASEDGTDDWSGWNAQQAAQHEAQLDALLNALYADSERSAAELLSQLTTLFAEKHMLLTVDDPGLQAALAAAGWDGGQHAAAAGDVLRWIETNLGYNQVNAQVSRAFDYQVSLEDLAAPTSELRLHYTNDSVRQAGCTPGLPPAPYALSTLREGCYWNYLRVFPGGGAQLLDAAVPPVPGSWLLSGEGLNGQTDALREIDGGDGVGALLVVPTTSEQAVTFTFALDPTMILTRNGTRVSYRLTIPKQPGIDQLSGNVLIQLPEKATVLHSDPDSVLSDGQLLFAIDQRTDVQLEVVFILPN